MLDLLNTFNRDPQQTIEEVGHATPRMSRVAIELAWHNEPEDFKRLTRAYGRHVEESSFNFGFCDVIANFFERAVVTTSDTDVLTTAAKALVGLGYNHNRWHVQGVVTRLLQDIRDSPTALAASDALREASHPAVEWTVSEFAERSLHPALRRTIDSICDSQKKLEA